jgi:SAM-dependent methyltransferase
VDEQAMIGKAVLDEQYSGTGRLSARQSLWRLRTGPALHTVVLDRAGLTGAETIVDVGCGNGVYLAELRRRGHAGPVLGLDRSAGMARHSHSQAATAVADAQALPLRDDSADVVLCLHMLYHVPDLGRAVAELRRVLRPGGTAMVTTNGVGHSIEVKRLLSEAADRVDHRRVDLGWDNRRFAPAIAREALGAEFGEVDGYEAGDTLQVPDPATVVDYLASWPPESIGLTEGAQWQSILAAAADLVAEHFTAHETFPVTSRVAIYRCR